MNLLIVDDEGNIRRSLRALLEAEGHFVREAGSAEEGLQSASETSPDAVLLDLALPGMNGLQALPLFQDIDSTITVVMMSGHASLGDAVEATRLGAFHFIEKPLSPEAVLLTLRGAEEVVRARDLTRALREEMGPDAELIGHSAGIGAVRETIRKVAPTNARVLITGESGTGKELVATAIHGTSLRASGPFIRVNSAAIPRDLVESEMFGHERGAFTGATERRRGRFELADGGTLFLDEVGDLGADAQAKLLRVLESGTLQRVGGSDTIQVDVRVIAATHRDLEVEVQRGTFREDLFFRLNVVPIQVPPLRHRREDIPLLVAHGMERLVKKHGLAAPRLAPEGLSVLEAHDWPGNVRELLNIVERLAILSAGTNVGAGDVRAVLPGFVAGATSPRFDPDDDRALRDRLADYERTLLQGALSATKGNIAEAARRLQTDRPNLYRRMKRLGLRDDADDPTTSPEDES